MSITDPLIKELKASFYPLMKLEKITDDSPLQPFCDALETIFNQGLIYRKDTKPPPWAWLNAVECEMNNGNIPRVFSYVRSVEETRDCQKVLTEVGKFRLLLRCCMRHKCLHVPVEVMVRQIGSRRNTWYNPGSVLGHEVLGEILLSVLLQASQLSFHLDTSNARFLDYSWELPNSFSTTFVPCRTLGLVVTFEAHMAVVVHLEKGSVAAEDSKIEPGDVLDELNGIAVTNDLRGKLKSILGKCRNQPITVRVLKTRCQSLENVYSPCLQMYRNVPALAHLCPNLNNNTQKREKKHELSYLGNCTLGRRGDVSLVEMGILRVAADHLEPRPVTIECRELDVLVLEKGNVMMRHPYVSIASCGHSINLRRHFAYIVGDAACNSATEYTCHVFVASTHGICATVLLSLGLGFDRTRCAV